MEVPPPPGYFPVVIITKKQSPRTFTASLGVIFAPPTPTLTPIFSFAKRLYGALADLQIVSAVG